MKVPNSRAELVAQLRREGIRDQRVLDAIGAIRREFFVPPSARHSAYADAPLPIGEGQTISQPYIVALMTEALSLEPTHRVLEIGSGSGYHTAILASIAARVISVERNPSLAERAELRLRALGFRNASIHVADGSLGWPDDAPYDAIVVSAGSPGVPPLLVEQLVAGGRLVVPVGNREYQSLQLVIRRGGELRTADLCPCRFVPLLGAAGWPED